MQNSKNRSGSVFLIIGIVFICISIGLCVYLIAKECEYTSQVDIIEDVKNRVVVSATEPTDDESSIISDDTDEHEEPVCTDANLLRRVDFDTLQEINPDATRWLYIPDSSIDSYILQEQTVGNYYYLWRDIYKKSSSSGSLLTPRVPLDADDPHLIIFGHRIFGHDDVGFSSLRLMYADIDTAAAYPYVYVYYADRAERWSVWAVADIHGQDCVYEYPYVLGSDRYGNMLEYVAGMSRFQNCEMPDAWTETLFLSTCNGTRGGSEVRLLVACVPDMTYYYETETLESFSDTHVIGNQSDNMEQTN